MAYDCELADRLRFRLTGRSDVVEKTMFGGRAFLVGGHLAFAAGNHGGLLLRADPTRAGTLLTDVRITPFVMRGREMTGWLHVDVDDTTPEDDLDGWVDLALDYVASLTPS